MKEKIYNRKKKVIYNIIFRLVTLVSIFVMIIFCMYLKKLGSIPNKYLIMIYVGLGILYLILMFLIVPRKFKINIKITVGIILIILDFIFVFSIRKIERKITVENLETEEIEKIEDNT